MVFYICCFKIKAYCFLILILKRKGNETNIKIKTSKCHRTHKQYIFIISKDVIFSREASLKIFDNGAFLSLPLTLGSYSLELLTYQIFPLNTSIHKLFFDRINYTLFIWPLSLSGSIFSRNT